MAAKAALGLAGCAALLLAVALVSDGQRQESALLGYPAEQPFMFSRSQPMHTAAQTQGMRALSYRGRPRLSYFAPLQVHLPPSPVQSFPARCWGGTRGCAGKDCVERGVHGAKDYLNLCLGG